MRFKRNEREVNEIVRGKRNIRVIGLTGGIASGKTVATDALKDAGFNVIDADEISRRLTAPGSECEKALTKMFPQAERDGNLDRKKLRSIISTDSVSRSRLDEYLHPIIIAEITRAVKSSSGPIVLAAPLLFETALTRLCDAVACIVCPKRIRIDRIVKRDGVSRDDAERMIDIQLDDTVRATLSDCCVPSDTDINSFREEIIELITVLTQNNH